jgi:hypothetical protein
MGVAVGKLNELLVRAFALAQQTGKSFGSSNTLRPQPSKEAETPTSAPIPLGFHPVLNGKTLVNRIRAEANLKSICERTRFGQMVFDRDCMPVLTAFFELVQLLPATYSRYHSGPAGLLVHALLSVNVALQLRLGEILPRGGASEDVHKREHRWTYGVMVCALFHDLGNLCSEFQVVYRTKNGDQKFWHPVEGSLNTIGAVAYRTHSSVEPGLMTQHAARLPVAFLHRLVPVPVLQWLADDRELMDEMLLCLSGVESEGAIWQFIQRSHQESISRATGRAVLAKAPVESGAQSIPAGVAETEAPPSQREKAIHANAPLQRELFSALCDPPVSSTQPIASAPSKATPAFQQEPRLKLPATLTLSVREALMRMFDAACRSDAAERERYFDANGWFVSLGSLEQMGVDTGMALKCLVAEGVIYLGGENLTSKIHTRRIADSDERGFIIKACFIRRPGSGSNFD